MFYFHNVQAAIPFHELSYYTIEYAEYINKAYIDNIKSGNINFFFFFPFSNSLYGDAGNLIPIIKGTPESLLDNFYSRGKENNEKFNSKAILILDTNE